MCLNVLKLFQKVLHKSCRKDIYLTPGLDCVSLMFANNAPASSLMIFVNIFQISAPKNCLAHPAMTVKFSVCQERFWSSGI